MYTCNICNRTFDTSRALGGHKSSCGKSVSGVIGVSPLTHSTHSLSPLTHSTHSLSPLTHSTDLLTQDERRCLGLAITERLVTPGKVERQAEDIADKVLRQGYVIDKPGRFQDVDWGKVAFVIVIALGAGFAAYRAYEYIDWEPKKKSISPYKIVGSLISGIGSGRDK